MQVFYFVNIFIFNLMGYTNRWCLHIARLLNNGTFSSNSGYIMYILTNFNTIVTWHSDPSDLHSQIMFYISAICCLARQLATHLMICIQLIQICRKHAKHVASNQGLKYSLRIEVHPNDQTSTFHHIGWLEKSDIWDMKGHVNFNITLMFIGEDTCITYLKISQ